MKKLFLFFALLTGLNLNAQTNSDWKWIHPTPQGQTLNWFRMISPTTWVAAGDYGIFLKTTNAGLTWKSSTGGYNSSLYPLAPIYSNFRSGWFIDSNIILLATNSSRGIVRTTNGGLSFDTVQIFPSNATFNAFHFINSTTGYVVGNTTVKIMKTTNAGLNWTPVPGVANNTYNCIYASDTNNIKAGSSSGNVFITTDAGVNWTTSNTGATSTVTAMAFINNNTGYVAGNSGLFRYTTNGGANWSGINPTISSLTSIKISGDQVIVGGLVSSKNIYSTTDNGQTWTNFNYDNQDIQMNNVYGLDKIGNTIVIAGSFGDMMKSTNNGALWTPLTMRVSYANMSDIYAQSGNSRVIAIGTYAGAPGSIFFSSNGGANWTTSNFVHGLSNQPSSIDMINSSTGYVSGRFGLFIKTTNGGETWDTSLSGNPVTSQYFGNGIDFINENTGWMVGGTPGIGGVTKIFKTTNGGVNWTEQTPANTGPIGVKIEMFNANTGYFTHSGGISKTTNGGENWTVTTPPAVGSVTYNNIDVIDANTVVTGGNNTQVYRTTNGGVSWDSLNFPVKSGTIFSTHWLNAQVGVAASVIGVIGKTTNGGQSWEIYNNGGYTVYSVKMVHPDTIYSVCGNTTGGQVIKYAKGVMTGVVTFENQSPEDYTLKQNYPNPFNPITTIEFNLPKAGVVSLQIFDITGRLISSEINNLSLAKGNYKTQFSGNTLSSGIYFYSLVVDGKNIQTKKMSLIK